MIERLMNPEIRYGEPMCSKIGLEIYEMKQTLVKQLDQEGMTLLDRLSDAYLQQSSVQIEDAFADGFCKAVDLLMEIFHHSK